MTRTTPLGFLPGSIDVRSHCMFVYPHKDEAFVRSVADYIAAGVNAGELCVCAMDQPARDRIRSRLTDMGVGLGDGQVQTPDLSDVYLSDAQLDTEKASQFWYGQVVLGRSRWKGLRAFGDVSSILESRAARLKALEYESRLNLCFGANIALCAYPCAGLPRSFVSHARDLHPFIANSRCVKRNHGYQTWEKFVAGFYRCKRVSREYSVWETLSAEAYEDLEETAARTLLSLREIDQLKGVLSDAVSGLLAAIGRKGSASRLHITFRADSSAFAVGIKHPLPDGDGTRWEGLNERELRNRLQTHPVDEVRVGCEDNAAVVILVKRYRNSNSEISEHLDPDWV